MSIMKQTIEDYIIEQTETYRLLWDKAKGNNSPHERKLYGKYMAYKELKDGINNGYFKSKFITTKS